MGQCWNVLSTNSSDGNYHSPENELRAKYLGEQFDLEGFPDIEAGDKVKLSEHDGCYAMISVPFFVTMMALLGLVLVAFMVTTYATLHYSRKATGKYCCGDVSICGKSEESSLEESTGMITASGSQRRGSELSMTNSKSYTFEVSDDTTEPDPAGERVVLVELEKVTTKENEVGATGRQMLIDALRETSSLSSNKTQSTDDCQMLQKHAGENIISERSNGLTWKTDIRSKPLINNSPTTLQSNGLTWKTDIRSNYKPLINNSPTKWKKDISSNCKPLINNSPTKWKKDISSPSYSYYQSTKLTGGVGLGVARVPVRPIGGWIH